MTMTANGDGAPPPLTDLTNISKATSEWNTVERKRKNNEIEILWGDDKPKSDGANFAGDTTHLIETGLCLSTPGYANEPFNPTEFLKKVESIITKYETTWQILPRDTTVTTKILTKATEYPKTKQEFGKWAQYLQTEPEAGHGRRHKVFIKVRSSKTINQLKYGTLLMNDLKQARIFVQVHNWSAVDVTAVGFLTNIAPNLAWRDDVHDILSECMEKGILAKHNREKQETWDNVDMADILSLIHI